MKTLMLYGAIAFFLFGTSFAHEIATDSVVTTHKSVVEYRIVQLNPKLGTQCTTRYTTTTTNGVTAPTRQSVDCDE